jgi:uncharacterized protein (TIGR00251 family)
VRDRPLVVERDGALEVSVRVQPRARRNALDGVHGGALKLRLAAPPVDGAANRAAIEFFARLFDVPRARLAILSGEKSRDKVLRIEGVSAADFRRKISVEI